MNFPFPKDFLFGAASSAVQIESACYEDGKGENVHDRNYKINAEQYLGADLNDTADFYYRYPEDIQLMKELGLKVFRFSVSWSRIYPNGPEQVNPKGLAYYIDVADKLLEAGIKPFFDLWHCDLPQWVAERGGLLHPEFIDWFTSYAKTVFEALGDRVAYWCTVNEPNINCMLAYLNGKLPPFVADQQQAIQACHNMILAHYKTIRLYKQLGLHGQVGSVVHFESCYGIDATAEDQAAAQRYQAYYSGWWLDPMLKGHYPEVLLQYPYIRDKMPENFQQQLDEAFIPSDFISVNVYNPNFVKYVSDDKMDYEVVSNDRLVKDAYGFYFYPEGLYDAVVYLHETYPGKDIFITENGIGIRTSGDPEKDQQDDDRVNYLREHLRALSRAIHFGVPVKGYFHWSVMDTHELRSGGHNIKFGLTQIDYATKERRPRKSWYYYQRVIRNCDTE